MAGLLKKYYIILGSIGTFSRTGVLPGIYFLRIVARDLITREKKVLTTTIDLNASEDHCTPYLINRQLRIDGNMVSVEYTSTGQYNGFMCSLNRQEIPCKFI